MRRKCSFSRSCLFLSCSPALSPPTSSSSTRVRASRISHSRCAFPRPDTWRCWSSARRACADAACEAGGEKLAEGLQNAASSAWTLGECCQSNHNLGHGASAGECGACTRGHLPWHCHGGACIAHPRTGDHRHLRDVSALNDGTSRIGDQHHRARARQNSRVR